MFTCILGLIGVYFKVKMHAFKTYLIFSLFVAMLRVCSSMKENNDKLKCFGEFGHEELRMLGIEMAGS